MLLLTENEETQATQPKPRSKIMIVDDDPAICLALTVRLRVNHYKTVSARDGYSALALAQEERPNLILLDLGLPREDGFAVLKLLPLFFGELDHGCLLSGIVPKTARFSYPSFVVTLDYQCKNTAADITNTT